MKRFLLFLCLVLLPSAASAQWNYASKAASDSLALALLKTSVDDSLLNYGIRPRLNANTWFNLYGTAGVDTVQSWKNSQKITVASLDSLGTLRVLNLYASNRITIPYVFLNSSGTAASPAIKWLSIDEDTGIYRVGPNRFGITAKGANVATFDSMGVAVTGLTQSDSMKVSSAGTSNNYLQSWWKNGVRKAYVDSSGNIVNAGLIQSSGSLYGSVIRTANVGSAAHPVFHYSGDTDTGLYWVAALGNSLGIAAKGANVATFDSSGVTVANTLSAKVAEADTFKANYAVLWGPNLADYTVVYTDSVASAGAANDTTGTRVYWRRYFSWDSAESPSMKTGIYSTVFHLGTETRYKPDSLVVNLWFDGTHANADSGAAMIVVKGQSGTIVSTGWVTVAAASTWEHKGYVIPTPFTRNEEYEILVYTKSVSGGRWCWSPPRFK